MRTLTPAGVFPPVVYLAGLAKKHFETFLLTGNAGKKRECKASFRQGPQLLRHLRAKKLTEETKWLKNILKQRASSSSWSSK